MLQNQPDPQFDSLILFLNVATTLIKMLTIMRRKTSRDLTDVAEMATVS